MHGFSPGPHAPRLSGSLGPPCLFIAHDSDPLSLDARAPELLFATSLYGPAPGPRPGPRPPLAFLSRHVPLRAGPGPRSGPRPHQPRSTWIGSGPLIQRTRLHLCCHHHGPHYLADRRCSMAHTTAHESNRECGALDPRALCHVEHPCPETGPFQVSAGSPRPSTGGDFQT